MEYKTNNTTPDGVAHLCQQSEDIP